ncbi:helix-turn-helix domain-containing protein [Schlesneria sp. T3-172]|uniref:helix-turn-helix domain-containing protein n=1 Tax=Schlesneria sphaerica TaxID=3373610 RepID=UPI0037CA2149
MITTREQQLRESLKRLAAIHAAEISILEESVAILQSELDALTHPNTPVAQGPLTPSQTADPRIDYGLMCVEFQGRHCFLGNTLMLKFFGRLARRPNCYLSYEVLLNDVWNAVRESSSVRSVVKELRGKLRAAGMSKLSDVIDGSVARHYGLMLNRLA